MIFGSCKKLLFLWGTLLLAGLPACDVARAAELVMFEQEGCPWCRRWDEDIGKIYEKTEEARLMPLRRIRIYDPSQGNIVLQRPVRYTPTFVVVDRGREVGRITGYIDDAAFWGLLGKLAEKVESPSNRAP